MALSVVFAASEAAPFAKTGGLADVAGALPAELARLGCRVSLFLPMYRASDLSGVMLRRVDVRISVPVGPIAIEPEIHAAEWRGVEVFFIRCDEYFDRSRLYGTPDGDYFDNLERFTFFSRAVVETIRAGGMRVDIVHTNDWQTALVPAYLRDRYTDDPVFANTRTVFTIHNLAYQGLFPADRFPITHLSPQSFTFDRVEFWGQLNLLKAGAVYSDAITTVSEGYAKEIQTEEHGCGLEGLMRSRHADIFGILNGVDYDEWDPATDPHIPARYSAADMSGKAACRAGLLKEYGLELPDSAPLIGIVSRLAEQKGLDILTEAIPALARQGLGIVILGTGERAYEERLRELAAKYPKRLAVRIGFDNALAHRIEAGSDIFLMPSRYEPCGLNQIYSLRYGTVPVVRATGGLDDTVTDYRGGTGVGFKFRKHSARALVNKVSEALRVFADRGAWAKLQKKGMALDYSWKASAHKYLDLYRFVIKRAAEAEEAAEAAREAARRAAAPPPPPRPEPAQKPQEAATEKTASAPGDKKAD